MVEVEDIPNGKDTKNAFGWYSVIITLAEERILDIPKVVQINHIEALNFLTYKIDLEDKRNRALNNTLR